MGVFRSCLKLERSHLDEDMPFRDLGLDSISALRIAERLQERLGTDVEPRLFFEYPTVRALCRALAERA